MHPCIMEYKPPEFPPCKCKGTGPLCQKRDEPDVCLPLNDGFEQNIGNAVFYGCPEDTYRCDAHGVKKPVPDLAFRGKDFDQKDGLKKEPKMDGEKKPDLGGLKAAQGDVGLISSNG